MASVIYTPEGSSSDDMELTNPLVELTIPLITISPPKPTLRSTLTYNPGMDYIPTAAASSAFTRDIDYAPAAAAENPYNPRSGDVRADYPLDTGFTTPSSSSTGTYLMPPSPHYCTSNNRRSGNPKRYNRARITRSNARAAAHAQANPQANPEANAVTNAVGQITHPLQEKPIDLEEVLHLLALLEESKTLHLNAFIKHGVELKELRAELKLMWASPDANSRLNEIHAREAHEVVLTHCVETYGRRFEDLKEKIEEKWDQLMAPPDDTIGTL